MVDLMDPGKGIEHVFLEKFRGLMLSAEEKEARQRKLMGKGSKNAAQSAVDFGHDLPDLPGEDLSLPAQAFKAVFEGKGKVREDCVDRKATSLVPKPIEVDHSHKDEATFEEWAEAAGGPKNKDEYVDVKGAGGVGMVANGRYFEVGVHNFKPVYKNEGGCIIFFEHDWKLNAKHDLHGWLYRSPNDLDGPLPPSGMWTTDGYIHDDADPPPMVKCSHARTLCQWCAGCGREPQGGPCEECGGSGHMGKVAFDDDGAAPLKRKGARTKGAGKVSASLRKGKTAVDFMTKGVNAAQNAGQKAKRNLTMRFQRKNSTKGHVGKKLSHKLSVGEAGMAALFAKDRNARLEALEHAEHVRKLPVVTNITTKLWTYGLSHSQLQLACEAKKKRFKDKARHWPQWRASLLSLNEWWAYKLLNLLISLVNILCLVNAGDRFQNAAQNAEWVATACTFWFYFEILIRSVTSARPGWGHFHSGWYDIDLLVQLMATPDIVAFCLAYYGYADRHNLMWMRGPQVFRVFRVLRAKRVSGSIRPLRAIVRTVSKNRCALLMVLYPAAFSFTIFAILLTTIVGPEQSNAPEEVRKYFDKVPRSMVAAVEVAAGGVHWGQHLVGPMLDSEDVSWNALGSVVFVLCAILAFYVQLVIVSTIIMLVMQTTKEFDEDWELQLLSAGQGSVEELKQLLEQADENDDGYLSLQEIQRALWANPRLCIELGMKKPIEVQALHRCLDTDGEGLVCLYEFAFGVFRLKAASRTMDMLAIDYRQKLVLTEISKQEHFLCGDGMVTVSEGDGHDVCLNGGYRATGRYEFRPTYQNDTGAFMYYRDGFWRLFSEKDTTEEDFMHMSVARDVPMGAWRSPHMADKVLTVERTEANRGRIRELSTKVFLLEMSTEQLDYFLMHSQKNVNKALQDTNKRIQDINTSQELHREHDYQQDVFDETKRQQRALKARTDLNSHLEELCRDLASLVRSGAFGAKFDIAKDGPLLQKAIRWRLENELTPWLKAKLNFID